MLANPPQSMEYTAVQCLHTPDQIVLRQFGAPCGVLGCSVTPRGVLYAHVVQARGGGVPATGYLCSLTVPGKAAFLQPGEYSYSRIATQKQERKEYYSLSTRT